MPDRARAAAPSGVAGALLCLLLLPACGDADGRAPPPGQYQYAGVHGAPGGGTATTLEGAVVFDQSTEESLRGRWEIDRISPEFGLGGWREDAYVVYAYPTYGGTLVHRIRFDAGSGAILCEGEYVLIIQSGEEFRGALECTIEPMPAPGLGPNVVAPPSGEARPIDADSVAAPLDSVAPSQP